jgi:putative peptidoglycan lipid II flippase
VRRPRPPSRRRKDGDDLSPARRRTGRRGAGRQRGAPGAARGAARRDKHPGPPGADHPNWETGPAWGAHAGGEGDVAPFSRERPDTTSDVGPDLLQDSAFTGYQPYAPTAEMRIIDDATLEAGPPGQTGTQTQPPAPLAPPEAPAPPTDRPRRVPSPRRSSFLVAAGILLSRLSGLLREVVIGRYLGTSPSADAFRAALRIPNLLQNLLGEGVLSASFIPVYARLRSQGHDEEAGRLAGAIAGLLLVLTGVLSLLGLVLAGPLTSLLASGLDEFRHDLTVQLVRIMFPGIGLLVLSAWCLGVLNSHRRFFLSYVAPVLWNAAQIIALVAVALSTVEQRSMAVALAWGVLIGGALQLAVQLRPTLRLLGRLRLSLDAGRASVRDVLSRFGPVVFSRGTIQILAFVDLTLASWLAAGAIAALGYAQVLYLLPIALFGMSVAAAELPDLSETRVYDPETRRLFRRRLEEGMARIGFYVAPTAAMFIVVGDIIVRLAFQRGDFTAGDTWVVWLALAAFATGLPAMTSSRLLQNGLYALDDARTPARVAMVRVVIAATIGLTLMFPLDRLTIGPDGIQGWSEVLSGFGPLPADVRADATVPHLGIVGLAIGASISAWTEYLMLSRALAWRIGRTRLAGRWLNPIALSCAAAAAVAYGMVLVTSDTLPAVVRAILVLLPAGLVYLGMTRWLGVPEAQASMERITRVLGNHDRDRSA